MCVAAVCVAREGGLVLLVEVTDAGLLSCAFPCLACDGPCDWSVGSCRFSRPSTVNHITVVVRLREDTDHQACQTCYRLGTLVYTQSFEVDLKVIALRGCIIVDRDLIPQCLLEA